tara:strand:+ start:1565 stop:1750 length:186 start_codon:yes stop_codon:yes gene_type:complete
MLDLEQLQIIGQLVDNIEIMVGKLEHSFKSKDSEDFTKSKQEISKTQRKINEMINKEENKR